MARRVYGSAVPHQHQGFHVQGTDQHSAPAGAASLYMVSPALPAYSAPIVSQPGRRRPCTREPHLTNAALMARRQPPWRAASARPTRSSSPAAATPRCGTSRAGATSTSPAASRCSTPATATRTVIAAVKAQLDLLHAHLLPGAGLRALRRAGRAAERAGAGRLREEDAVPVHRRRGGGERGEDRARLHRPRRRHRLHRRLPRPHA